jgi:hypothetical protein
MRQSRVRFFRIGNIHGNNPNIFALHSAAIGTWKTVPLESHLKRKPGKYLSCGYD